MPIPLPLLDVKAKKQEEQAYKKELARIKREEKEYKGEKYFDVGGMAAGMAAGFVLSPPVAKGVGTWTGAALGALIGNRAYFKLKEMQAKLKKKGKKGGWFLEQYRHQLARKGIKTGRKKR